MSTLVTLREYARLHNLSPATVRRRIKAGSVLAELIDGPRGPQYIITVDNDEAVQAEDSQQATHAQGSADGYAQPADGVHGNGQLYSHLEQEVTWLRQQLETSREAERELRVVVLTQAQQLQALPQTVVTPHQTTVDPQKELVHLYLSQIVGPTTTLLTGGLIAVMLTVIGSLTKGGWTGPIAKAQVYCMLFGLIGRPMSSSFGRTGSCPIESTSSRWGPTPPSNCKAKLDHSTCTPIHDWNGSSSSSPSS